MSFLGSIGKFFKKIFDFIKDILKKIVDALGPFLPLLIIAAFVFWSPLATWLADLEWYTAATWVANIGSTVSAYGMYATAAVGLGVAALVAPEQTGDLIAGVGDIVGDVVGAIGGAAGAGVVGLFSSIPSWIYILGGVALVWYLSKDDDSAGEGNK